MNTKMYAWQFYLATLKILAERGITKIDFREICELLKNYANIYDNRSLKNYIDCMVNNQWVTEDNTENPLNPNGLLKNQESPLYEYSKSNNCITLYKNTIFVINKEATYDKPNSNEFLEKLIKRKEKETKLAPTPLTEK